MMKTRIILLIVSAVLISVGCASTKQARDVDASKLSGFLDDYSILRKGVAEEALLVYRNPQALWPVYKNIIIDPAEIWLMHEEKRGISHEDLQRLANNFYLHLNTHLSNDYTIMGMPGPHTLRLQVALTDVETSSAGLDAVTTVLPVGIALSKVKEFATGKPTFVGEASIEFRITDARSGVLLAAGVDRKVGGKTLKEIGSWTDADNAMEAWAKTIRSRLCFMRGGKKCR